MKYDTVKLKLGVEPPPSASTANIISLITRQLNSPVMGEQTHNQTPIEPDYEATTLAFISTTTTTEATATTTDLANVLPHKPPPATKIPLRPRKIRKLSPDASDGRKPSQTAAAKIPKSTASQSTKKVVLHQPKPIPRIVARSLSCEGEVDIALRYLRNADPQLAHLIDIYPPPTFDSFHPPFLALTKSILYQQLAYKAGTSIYTRFVSLCGGEAGVLPDTLLAQTPQQLRQIGVSGRKASYLHDLARKYQNGILSDSSIVEMDDKSLFTMLTMVNGIGSWSVHMFMIFSLHRPDVLPIHDLGIRKGVQLLYGLEELPRPSQMEQLCEKWRPYRSVASWYMWRFVEAKGPPSSAGALAAAGTSLQPQQLHHQQNQQHHLQHQQHHLQQDQQHHLQQDQQHHLQQLHQQQQQQFLDPIHSILNLGCCFPVVRGLGPVHGDNDRIRRVVHEYVCLAISSR